MGRPNALYTHIFVIVLSCNYHRGGAVLKWSFCLGFLLV